MTRFCPALLPIAVVFVHVVVINCLPVKDEVGVRYRTNKELENFLITMADQHPDKVHTFSIGKSVEGNNIMAVAVAASDPHLHLTLRPNVLFTANIHGNEVVGREILLHLLSHLLTAYGEHKLITELMDSTRLVMIPSMNPDGFNAAVEGDCFTIRGRSNKHGVDLNRNYPNIWHPTRVHHEPETSAFINWVKTVPIVLDFYSAAPDDDVFRNIALQYSKSSETMASMVNTWCPPDPEIFKDGITNGADWYGIEGSLQDYMYVFKGATAFTLEISCCKYPFYSSFRPFWVDNLQPILKFWERAKTGIKGVVREKETQDPVVAKMKIIGREIPFFSNCNGEFYRILLPGKYRLIVSVEHYDFQSLAKTISG
ncbi:Peptidase M14 domain containing protein [Trichuris trichiura]|uniref:Peptidase M14 domain containing protein n=1 Tax=Trichuris trichiura TaxID=36087 RepID=A0A077ZB29_TRITR|nr:Peptidase M14 domain containing protein [Trichuris trichiura]